VVCDFVILHVLKKRHVYKKKKYLYVEGDDPYITALPQVHVYIFFALFDHLLYVTSLC